MPTQFDYTIKKDGSGNYTSIKSFVAAEGRDLVALDQNIIVTIYGAGWDSITPLSETYVDFAPFNSSPTCDIKFIVRPEDRHTFVEGTGFVFTVSTSYGFVCRNNHITFDGFEIADTSNTNSLWHSVLNVKLLNCLVHDIQQAGVFGGYGENNIHYGYAGGSSQGFYASNAVTKNVTCIMQAGENDYSGTIALHTVDCTNVILWTGKPPGGNDAMYNCSGDYNAINLTGEGVPGANSVTTLTTDDFEDFANKDYRLKSTSSLVTAGEGGSFMGAVVASGGGEPAAEVTIQPLVQTQSLQQCVVIQEHNIMLNSLTMPQTVEDITLNQAYVVAVDNLSMVQIIATTDLAVTNNVALEDLIQAHAVEGATVDASNVKEVLLDALQQTQNLTETSILQENSVIVDNLSHQQLTDILYLGGVAFGYFKGEPLIFYPYNGDIMIVNALTLEIK